MILRNLPDLQDKPVAVCHSDNPKGTAEISSANYPARDYGLILPLFFEWLYIFLNLFQKQVLNITNLLDNVLMAVLLIVVEIIILHASGVRAGMFVGDAKALCPHLVIFPYNFKAYEEVNHFI